MGDVMLYWLEAAVSRLAVSMAFEILSVLWLLSDVLKPLALL
jgi:hypothetical protein